MHHHYYQLLLLLLVVVVVAVGEVLSRIIPSTSPFICVTQMH